MDKRQSIKHFKGKRIALHPGSQSGARASTVKKRGVACLFASFV